MDSSHDRLLILNFTMNWATFLRRDVVSLREGVERTSHGTKPTTGGTNPSTGFFCAGISLSRRRDTLLIPCSLMPRAAYVEMSIDVVIICDEAKNSREQGTKPKTVGAPIPNWPFRIRYSQVSAAYSSLGRCTGCPGRNTTHLARQDGLSRGVHRTHLLGGFFWSCSIHDALTSAV